MNACVWHRGTEKERVNAHKALTTVLALTHIHTQIRTQIHTLSTYTLPHINTLNWGSGYRVTHLAAL